LITGEVKVATKVFDSFFMNASRLIRELGALMDCKGDIQSSVGGDEVELADD